ncbi:MAG: hypothetical protein L3J21_02340 [Devosiaceae bacterium]|nr:hypothetical protein [Devosiaceae bacterium]
MKFFLILLIFGLMVLPANATPPNLVCWAGNDETQISFVLPLSTSYSSFYDSGVIPLSMTYAEFEYADGEERRAVEFYSEHIIAQWLGDGRADIRLFLEEVDENEQATGYDLIVRTKSTGRRSEESGQYIHQGSFEFRIINGFAAQGDEEIILEISGKAECS